ncbi:MAG: CoA ester lyase [Gaiellales bacterium]|jgi:citrate lyase subunit beta/citryl-CoA lyase|nr:CoA ester lyase [Gaiellales bacterium]
MSAPIRTLMFASANDPVRSLKAIAIGASAVCLDLEDAVATSEKAAAREVVAQTLLDPSVEGANAHVRINGVDTAFCDDDLTALGPLLPRLSGILVPMVESADQVRHVAARLDALEAEHGVDAGAVRLIAIAETAKGVLAAPDVASSTPRLRTLLLGPADLAHDLGIELTADGYELFAIRSQLVLAARAAGLEGPIDGPFLGLKDDEGTRISAQWAKRLGYQGKMVLHPQQLPVVAEVFAPSAEEITWAQTVVAAFAEHEAKGISAFKLEDGTFVDYPVVHRAQSILRDAGV